MLYLYNVNKLQFWEVKIVFHWGRNIRTLPRAHKCLVPALIVGPLLFEEIINVEWYQNVLTQIISLLEEN
jgi:hypothetical protein